MPASEWVGLRQSSKSPKAVIIIELLAAEQAFPFFRNKNVPKKVTQHHLLRLDSAQVQTFPQRERTKTAV